MGDRGAAGCGRTCRLLSRTRDRRVATPQALIDPFTRARHLLASGRARETITAFEAAGAGDSADAEILAEFGQASLQVGEFGRAQDLFTRARVAGQPSFLLGSPMHFQRAFEHGAVGHVPVSSRLFGEQESFEGHGSHRKSVEVDRLRVRAERVLGFATGVEQHVDDERVRDADVVAIFKP